MTLRMPRFDRPQSRGDSFSALEAEIVQLKAQTLGDLGQKVEAALAALRTFDAQAESAVSDTAVAGRPAESGQRSALLDAAAERVWMLMIQRELCGLRHWDQVVKAYGIPREVLNRMGRTAR